MNSKYGMLTIIKRVDAPIHLKDKKSVYYLCKCDCGNEKVIRKTSIINGSTVSCGCHRKKSQSKRMKDKAKHDMYRTRFYGIWRGMIRRCTDENVDSYKYYGGIGISVCDEWKDFENFMKDMHDSYLEFESQNGKGTATLDRIDVNGNYELSNCEWKTMKEQSRNRRNNIKVEVDGVTYSTLSELAESYNLDYQLITQRYRNGKRDKELIAPKKRSHKGTKHKSIAIEVNGIMYDSLTSLQKDYSHISRVSISKRYKRGIRGKELVCCSKTRRKST
ncbi:hypothetical protein NXG04_07950 [Klebsiella pneumoniae]|nr:hypothetical protein [Klebsiella pneumoniae]MDS7714488.1 hypothetical protein [Klebsiella pneumoniae]